MEALAGPSVFPNSQVNGNYLALSSGADSDNKFWGSTVFGSLNGFFGGGGAPALELAANGGDGSQVPHTVTAVATGGVPSPDNVSAPGPLPDQATPPPLAGTNGGYDWSWLLWVAVAVVAYLLISGKVKL